MSIVDSASAFGARIGFFARTHFDVPQPQRVRESKTPPQQAPHLATRPIQVQCPRLTLAQPHPTTRVGANCDLSHREQSYAL